ncbi:MAG: stage II sporulation protein P [Candidatus Improbicoccus devescovinae]|nr:MAG: stage II sporulation protein P [Candidatus Improbicoccus devescovinae]
MNFMIVSRKKVTDFLMLISGISAFLFCFFCFLFMINTRKKMLNLDYVSLIVANIMIGRNQNSNNKKIFSRLKNFILNENFIENKNKFASEGENIKLESTKKIPDQVTNSDVSRDPALNSEDTIINGKYKIIENHFCENGTKFLNFYVKNATNSGIDVGYYFKNKVNLKPKNAKTPSVLIFHTHTSESYINEDLKFFNDSFSSRSQDCRYTVVAVGEEIVNALQESGIKAIHDKTVHDYPGFSGSYSRSAATVKNNIKKFPSIKLVIDIHRDSIGDKETGKIKPIFMNNNQKSSQIMIVSGHGFPNWEKNFSIAVKLQHKCETMFPGFTRPLIIRDAKYNQNLTPGSLLIEIGSDVNTIEEAKRSGKMLGSSIAEVIKLNS